MCRFSTFPAENQAVGDEVMKSSRLVTVDRLLESCVVAKMNGRKSIDIYLTSFERREAELDRKL